MAAFSRLRSKSWVKSPEGLAGAVLPEVAQRILAMFGTPGSRCILYPYQVSVKLLRT